jgi:putative transposase
VPVTFPPHGAPNSGTKGGHIEDILLGTGGVLAWAGGMPRTPINLQNEFPYHVTARSNNREWFSVPLELCWHIFVKNLDETHRRYKFQTHLFLLMSNHFHWGVSTPDCNLSEGMQYFMTRTSHEIARAAGRINKIYGARYNWSVIGSPIHYANVFRYIYQNPLRAGICSDVRQYRWSTYIQENVKLNCCHGFEEFIPSDQNELMAWLNQTPLEHFAPLMKKALRRKTFKFPAHPASKRPVTGLEFL